MNAKVDISNVNDGIKQKPEVVQFLNDYESYKNGYHNPTNVPEDIKSTVWFLIWLEKFRADLFFRIYGKEQTQLR